MIRAQAGANNLFSLKDWAPPFAPGFQDTTGKTLVDAAVIPGERTAIYLSLGQSLPCNYSGTPYTPTSPKVHNFDIYSRRMYRAADPLLGPDGPGAFGLGSGNYLTRLGDKLIAANKYDRVIFIPVAVGGTSIAEWGLSGRCNHRIRVGLACLQFMGAPLTGVLWDQGNADRQLDTSQAAYQNTFAEVVATIRNMGCAAPIYVARESKFMGSAGAQILAAQDAVVDPSHGIKAGADMDSIPQSERSDGTHLNAAGSDHAAMLWNAIL